MVVFLPNITKDIENMIGSCNTCASMAHNQARESMIASPIPTYPLEHVGTDIFEFMGIKYLTTDDCYSRFIELDKQLLNLKPILPDTAYQRPLHQTMAPSFHQKSSKISWINGALSTIHPPPSIPSLMDSARSQYRQQNGSWPKL
ncbi:hypothetical protein QYM36_004637 [Artemia franciscana]|uniref:Integrase zinc-binding domain-containing protein n=1 Tax=Artemia franciscana TaxID=6661 RepID=A0AA88LC82_ARTSF|nr:hypothetical protein QYM36_004637 [Artemia franciscana]